MSRPQSEARRPTYGHWASLPYWSLLQTALLLLDRDPLSFWTENVCELLASEQRRYDAQGRGVSAFFRLQPGGAIVAGQREQLQAEALAAATAPPAPSRDPIDPKVADMAATIEFACAMGHLAHWLPDAAEPWRSQRDIEYRLLSVRTRPRAVLAWLQLYPDAADTAALTNLLRAINANAVLESSAGAAQRRRWNEDRVESAFAALAVVIKRHEECRDRRSTKKLVFSARAVAEAVHAHAHAFWPNGEPPHSVDELRRLIRQWTKALDGAP